MSQLVTCFKPDSPALRSDRPLSDDEIRAVVPSIFGEDRHPNCSARYSYIPTAAVLSELRKEGFQPFMACQTRVRREDRREFTKHLLRLRHASQINGGEANEVVLINSHDGSSAYQMLSGRYVFVCENGLACGDTFLDVRVPHKGDVAERVVEGAYEILQGFERVENSREAMRAVSLDTGEQEVFARAALSLRYDPEKPAPVSEGQLLEPRRIEDRGSDLWSVFNRCQEGLVKGGLEGRTASGRRQRTRPVWGIDQNLKLNRALWMLAEEMRKLKA
ncbi:MAG: DUF945 domain-containing protein [Candidatus Accumulibacter sp.]|jgi:hypothetical protein|nr:DUF945 domain-containing protein [Accumulibacter sp.]